MKLKLKKIIYCSAIVFILNGCKKEPAVPKNNSIENSDNSTYQINNGYKLFYGTWEYTEVVSQHKRIGGDEGYSSLIGTRITYHPEYFENISSKIDNPTYLISMYPIKHSEYNQFFPEQIGLEELLPNSEYFSLVQIVNKPNGLAGDLNGFTFIIKNDDTIYEFDKNCIYRLKRVNYFEDYDPGIKPGYEEHW